MVAFVLVLIAVSLQLLGYGGTCTQGSDEEALAGAVFSAPFLLLAAALMARQAAGQGGRLAPNLVAGLIAAGLVAATSVIWLSVLRFGNGCAWRFEGGYDPSYDNGIDIRNTLMIGSYLVLPSLIALLVGFDTLFGAGPGSRERSGHPARKGWFDKD